MTEPIRACIIVGRYPPDFSGHGIQIQRMLPYLRAEGIAPTVVTRRAPADIQWATEDEVPVERILSLGREPIPRLQRIGTLMAYLTRNARRFDVLHAAMLDWGLYLGLPIVQRLGLPTVFEMILLGSDDPFSISRHRFGQFKLNRLKNNVDAWVGITGAFLPELRKVGIPDERFHLLYGGVDVDAYRPVRGDERAALRADLGLPGEARIAVSVGAVQYRKGMDRVLRAWQKIDPKRDRDLLLLVGPQSEAEGLRPVHMPHVHDLRRMVAEAGLGETVRFVGRVDDVERYVAASDVFVFLSRREGLGYVILEALSSGLPCIVSPLDGIAEELLDDGGTGFIMEDPDDAEAVAARLAELFQEGSRRTAMGEAARREAVERFSLAARASRLAGIYKQLAGRPCDETAAP